VVGLFFLYGFTSALLGGVGRDAGHIAARQPAGLEARDERCLGAVG
jgi:hypothetical protein